MSFLHKRKLRFRIHPRALMLAAVTTLLVASGNAAEQTDRRAVLVAGGVSHNFKKHLRNIAPINNYLSGKLAAVGVKGGEVRLSSDINNVIAQFRQREIDWTTETAFGAAEAVSAGVAEAVALRWRKGKRSYASIIRFQKTTRFEAANEDLHARSRTAMRCASW